MPFKVDAPALERSASMRLFWKGRESSSPLNLGSENRAPYNPDSFRTSKRPSVENLRRVSKVTNSSIIAHEQTGDYDPANVSVPQRPLLSHRLSQRKSTDCASPATPNQTVLHHDIGKPEIDETPKARSPGKDLASPTKSSLSRPNRIGDPVRGVDGEIWDDASRHLKTVTFDAAPPQVKEYEMSTPDLSVITSESHGGSEGSEECELDLSFDPDASAEKDDSFDASLEDVEKTPVVLPEDWRFMSPDNADDGLVNEEDDDPFTDHYENRSRPQPVRGFPVESLDQSNPERRPLPPLPSMRAAETPRPSSSGKLPFGFDNHLRAWPLRSPPTSSNHSNGGDQEPLGDKFSLLTLNDAEGECTKDRNDGSADQCQSGGATQDHTKDMGVAGPEFMPIPRITRESILPDIRGSNKYLGHSYEESSRRDANPTDSSQYEPDVPIPTLEEESGQLETSVEIKQEQADDVHMGPHDHHDKPFLPGSDRTNSSDHDGSEYSGPSKDEDAAEQNASSDDSVATAIDMAKPGNEEHSLAANAIPLESPGHETLNRAATPENAETDVSDDEFSTPGSVIRRSVDEEEPPAEEGNVPDPAATVKASGGKLKTRPSLSKADTAAMAATRRRVSGQAPPPMLDINEPASNDIQSSAPGGSLPELRAPVQNTLQLSKPERKTSLVKLDIPFSIQEESLGFGLDKEFDRVMETQKVLFERTLPQENVDP